VQAEAALGRRVLLVDPIHPHAEAWLSTRCDILHPAGTDLEQLMIALAGCDGLIVGRTRITARLLESSDRLRVVAKQGTGTDNIDLAAASSRAVVVTSCPGENAPAVAEFTLTCLLLTLRPVVASAEWLRQSGADSRSPAPYSRDAALIGAELSSQTVGIVGWGNVGRRVGVAATALGAHVIAYDALRSPSDIRADGVDAAADLDGLLRVVDILSLHVPLTPATENLIGAGELAAMKPGAALVNTSRGGIVDEVALAEAVRSGHLRAAAVDTFVEEPPAPDHPLLALSNVLCTPHIGANTTESLARMGMCAARAVVDVLSGRRPEHVVNPNVA
jgi:phosphoglycerate dehydrogenase-like enzyme